MKFTLLVACLTVMASSTNAVHMRKKGNGPWVWDSSKTPWDKDSLTDCPGPGRTIMDDGKTHVSKYPNVGATCKFQTG